MKKRVKTSASPRCRCCVSWRPSHCQCGGRAEIVQEAKAESSDDDDAREKRRAAARAKYQQRQKEEEAAALVQEEEKDEEVERAVAAQKAAFAEVSLFVAGG